MCPGKCRQFYLQFALNKLAKYKIYCRSSRLRRIIVENVIASLIMCVDWLCYKHSFPWFHGLLLFEFFLFNLQTFACAVVTFFSNVVFQNAVPDILVQQNRCNKLGAVQTRRRSNSAQVKLGAGQTRRRSNSAQVKLGASQTRRQSNSVQVRIGAEKKMN